MSTLSDVAARSAHTLLAEDVVPVASDGRLVTAAVLGIVVIVVLITVLDLHPFLSLTIGAVGVGIGAGLGADAAIAAFVEGFGSTMGSVGILIGFGAMFGKLLADSGGADRVVDTLVERSSPRTLPWMMGLIGAVIGLPMFFEIGIVLLMPVILLVARRSGLPIVRVAIPTLAGLSAMHGLVPPHPGPLVAISALDANLGLTLALGVAVAIPSIVIAGPLFSTIAARWVPRPLVDVLTAGPASGLTAGGDAADGDEAGDDEAGRRPRPSFGATIATIATAVVLMLAKAVADIVAPDSAGVVKRVVDFLGTPVVALGLAVIVAMVVLGRGARMSRKQIASSIESSLPPVAGILLIVGAGGGFKQVLVDTGIAGVIADAVMGSSLPVLFLAWLVAVLIRVATGSATVATVTASGILAPVAAQLGTTDVSLMVLAIGAGSLFLSHVNDAGFWLVKEYLGMSVKQNLQTWSMLECIISVCGLAGVLALSAVI